MNLSIIIVTHNSNKYIDGSINSIYAQRYKKYKIFIIDNNSLDKKYLQKYNNKSQTELIFLNDNHGYCGGNNIGIEKSINESDFLVIMNPDVVLPNTFCGDLISVTDELNNQSLEN